MPKNYAMSYTILTFRTDFEVFGNLPLCVDCLYIELFFFVTRNRS